MLLGNGGTTTFWDAATFSLVDERSEHLSFGEFSSKFAAATRAAPHLADPLVVESEPGTHPDVVVDDSVDTYALTHNETSTGVMAPIARPRGADGIVLVDATSAAGGMLVDAGEFDCYYFAPQKSFASRRGALARGVLAAGDRAHRAAQRLRTLDPPDARPEDRPRQLAAAADLQHARARHAAPAALPAPLDARTGRARLHRGEVRPLRRDPLRLGRGELLRAARTWRSPRCAAGSSPRSTSTTRIDALAVAGVLRRNGVVDTEPYRKLGRNQLRIAMFPSIDPEDVAALCACIDWVVDALR